jgi:hypothetical protein
MSEFTTITVTRQVRDELAALGSKDDTFEVILTRLLAEHKARRQPGDKKETGGPATAQTSPSNPQPSKQEVGHLE